MSQKQNNESSYKTPAYPSKPELYLPLSFMDRLIQDQHSEHGSSSTNDFLMTMLDCMTDYIVQKVCNDLNKENMQLTSQDEGKAADSNGGPNRNIQNEDFTPFDQMPGSRRKG